MSEIDNQEANETSLSKRERNELKRQARQKENDRRLKVAKLKAAAPWLVFVVLAVGGTAWLISAGGQRDEARLGEAITIMGRDHISVGSEHETYNSNPPTSGPHAEAELWGFREEEIPDEKAIHNLEHGGIWISYKDLDEESVDLLRQIAKENSQSVIVSPRAANDVKVAVASWGRLMKLDTVDEAKIREFIRKNKNKSPERLAR